LNTSSSLLVVGELQEPAPVVVALAVIARQYLASQAVAVRLLSRR
jgi:hypothetical protein